jgi:hypothetical protein
MRSDFHKVIAERPRSGHSLPSRKTGWSTSSYDPDRDDDRLPVRESMSWNTYSPRKHFSDHLAPLRRYLHKQVGRPWHKVEADLRKAIDLSTLMGRHLWSHAESEVEVDVWIDERGVPRRTVYGTPVRDLYVHPKTGLLRRVKDRPVDAALERRRRIALADEVRLDERTRAERIREHWYLFVETGKIESVAVVRFDAMGRPTVQRRRQPQILKKQANRKEIERIREAIEQSVR